MMNHCFIRRRARRDLKATAQIQRVHHDSAIAFSSLVCLLIALFATGCHKSDAPAEQQQQPPPTDTSSAPAAEPSSAAPLPPPPAPSLNLTTRAENAVQANVAGEVNESLTRQLRIFIEQQGRMPQTFAELAVDIAGARIATERGAAIDTFYVRELDGGKIISEERHKLIGNKLREAISRLDVAE